MRRRLVSAAVVALVIPACWPVHAAAATPTCHGKKATIVGTSSNDVLHGTAGTDVIVGRGGNDTIEGRAGADWICGGRGHDRLIGGRGADHLFGGKDWVHVTDEGSTERFGDFLQGGAGSDRLDPGRDTRAADDVTHDQISWATAPGRMHIDTATGVATGQGRDVFVSRGAWVVGSDFGDTIEGSAHRDLVSGGRGADRISTHGGNDWVFADPGTGAGGGDDVVRGGGGDDQITASGGEDVLRGGRGNDVIDDLGASADRMYGGHGRDQMFAQLADVPGATQIVRGGPGVQDSISVFTNRLNPSGLRSTGTWNMTSGALVFDLDAPVGASILGFESADLISFGTIWTIQGSSGADTLSASLTGGTTFRAGAGDDTFMGSASDDLFDGAAGTDHSQAMGAGNDTCISVEVIDGNDCETITP